MRSIRFRAGARTTPKSFHRGGFWRYLLSEQKVTYEKIVERMRLFRVARAAAAPSRRTATRRGSCVSSAVGEQQAPKPKMQSAGLHFFPLPSANSKPNTPTITRLRCQSSLTFGGMTSYLFHKTGVTPASTSRPYYKKNRPRESRSRPNLPLSHYSAFTCKASELLRLAALFL